MTKDITKEIDDLLAISTNKIKDVFFYTANSLLSDKENYAILKQYFLTHNLEFNILISSLESILKGTNNFYKYESLGYFEQVEKDLYFYVSSFSGFIPDFEYGNKKLRPLIKVLKFIHNLDKSKFESVIKKDFQKAIYLYFMVGFEIDFTYKELTGYLNSNDKVIQNGALYYLISKLESLVNERQFIDENNENSSELNILIENEIKCITDILCNLSKSKKIELVIDYYFYIHRNDIIANKLNNELINFSGNLSEIIKNRVEINNPYALIKLIPLLSRNELKELFKIEFLNWFKDDFNKTIWTHIQEKILEALENNDIKVLDELNKIKLFVSDFDKQTRYTKYLKDREKSDALSFINNLYTQKAS